MTGVVFLVIAIGFTVSYRLVKEMLKFLFGFIRFFRNERQIRGVCNISVRGAVGVSYNEDGQRGLFTVMGVSGGFLEDVQSVFLERAELGGC